MHTRLLTHKWHELLVLTTSAYQAIHGPRKTWSGPEPTEHDFVQQVNFSLATFLIGLFFFNNNNQIKSNQTNNKRFVGLCAGISQPSHPSNMFSRHDGSTLDPGSVETGCGPHGGAHHPRHDDAAKEPVADGRVCLSQSHRHAQPTWVIFHSFFQFYVAHETFEFNSFLFLIFDCTAKGSGSVELEAIQERYMQCLQSYVEHNYPQSPGRFSDLLSRLPEVRSTSFSHFTSLHFTQTTTLNAQLLVGRSFRSNRLLPCCWKVKCFTFLSCWTRPFTDSHSLCACVCVFCISPLLSSSSKVDHRLVHHRRPRLFPALVSSSDFFGIVSFKAAKLCLKTNAYPNLFLSLSPSLPFTPLSHTTGAQKSGKERYFTCFLAFSWADVCVRVFVRVRTSVNSNSNLSIQFQTSTIFCTTNKTKKQDILAKTR